MARSAPATTPPRRRERIPVDHHRTVQQRRVMRNRVVLVGIAILLLAGGSWLVATQSLPHRAMVTHKVSGDLYMLEGQGGSVAAYVTGEGVILVDDMYDENHGEIIATVKSL